MRFKKFLTLLLLLALVPNFIFSQTDTITAKYVGPGVKHISITFPSVPWRINILEIDITNPFINLETVKASKNGREQLYAFEKTSSMAGRKNWTNHTVIGAINGDFYDTNTGIPVNVQVENGEILRRPISRSVFGITVDKKPFIEIFNYYGEVFAGDSSRQIEGINEKRGADTLILYNSYFGFSTGTNQWGTEVLIRPLGDWVINDTVYCVVDSVVSWVGNMSIPLGKAVLSGHGSAGGFLRNNVKVKDTVKILLRLNPNVGRIFQAIGGLPRIIRNGVNVVAQTYQQEGASSSFTYSRHPRTAVGISRDSTKIYFLTVDGRQSSSVGMTLDELANFMLTLGVWQGVNLDGGGSTTMVVRGKVVNSPSDATGERSVSNAILVVSSAPQDTLNKIEIYPKRLKIFRGEQFQFKFEGYDRYFNPVNVPLNQIFWSCDSTIGKIDLSGLFTAGKKHDSGYVYIQHINGLKDSCFVVVHTLKEISISPKKAITDTSRAIQFSAVGFDTEGNLRKISASEIEWEEIGGIGSVNILGLFRAFSEGNCKVVGKFDELSDTAEVQVIIGVGEKLVEKFDELNFYLTGENIDTIKSKIFLTDTNFISPSKVLGVEYNFVYTSGKHNWVYVNSNIPILGVPDSIYIYAYGDGGVYRLYYFVSDDNDEIFVFSVGTINWSGEWRKLGVSTKYPIQTVSGSYFCYPIKIVKLALYFAGSYVNGAEYTGKILFDDLSVTYPVKVTMVEDGSVNESLEFKLYPNFPNPFNPKTKLKFSISHSASNYDVEVVIYDLLGRKVKELLIGRLNPGVYELELEAMELASGVYFCVLRAGKFYDSIKIIALK